MEQVLKSMQVSKLVEEEEKEEVQVGRRYMMVASTIATQLVNSSVFYWLEDFDLAGLSNNCNATCR